MVSSFLVACGGDAGTSDREALERESLERELELALQPDTTVQLTLTDVPEEEPTAPPVSAPAPAPRPTTPRPSPAPSAPPRQTTPTPPAPAPAPAPAPTPQITSYTVPAGTTFAVNIDESLSTSTHAVGSTFTATLAEPIYAPDGTLLIPAGAQVRGMVVESRESGRAGESAHLAVEFTSISHAGRTYAIAGAALDTPVRLVTRDSNAEKAAKIGGGAAIGAVLGQVIGRNTRSTVAGAAIGAAAGTAVAIGTADVDAVVDAGSRVRVRLDNGMTVDVS